MKEELKKDYVHITIRLPLKANKLLQEAANRSRRSKIQEVTARVIHHLNKYESVEITKLKDS